MRLAVLFISAIYFFACSPVTDNGVAIDADPATPDSAVIDAGDPDASNATEGDLGGACFANRTCNRELVCNPQQICVEPPCMPSNIIYLNRTGGTYTSGPDDSRTNTSSIPPNTVTLSPRTITKADWDQLLIDTRQIFVAYDVAVVDQDPGDVPHLEIVLTDSTGADFGVPGTLGISPGCSTDFSLIGFMFAATVPIPLAHLVASRATLTMGLSYTTECNDLMTYDFTCIGSTFSNVPLNCGQNNNTACRCKPSESKQNSHAELLGKLGASVCPNGP